MSIIAIERFTFDSIDLQRYAFILENDRSANIQLTN
jgi:hypothetical protein